MKKLFILTIFLCVFIVCGCSLAKNQEPSTTKINNQNQQTVVGDDKDEHNCIGSAGYSWCEAKQKCIRSWEEYCTSASSTIAIFVCDNSKKITATFYPKDDKYVDLVLSDDRNISVPHAISASGARYAKSDESFVFWNKGNTAFITENNTTTFLNCITNQ